MVVRKPVGKVSESQLQKDLEKYRQRAVELGATDARVIPADMVVIDERVCAKCQYPRCTEYGTNANCPPYAMKPEDLRKVVKNFKYAIVVQVKVPSHDITGAEAKEKNLPAPYRRKATEIAAKIESEAFHDGHYLALALGGGSCKSLFCPNLECQALTPGQTCRQKFKARSSMEAVGIDCYDLATKAGWTIYPIGLETPPEDVPYGMRMSLVFVA